MAWVKLDDAFASHPKLLALGYQDRWVHVAALCYAQRHHTEGHVPQAALRQLEATRRNADRLVAVGLWEPEGTGWVIHDWHSYNGRSPEAMRAYRYRRRKAELS